MLVCKPIRAKRQNLQVVIPVEARCPNPKAPDPGFMRKPAPVLEPLGRSFWMKLTTDSSVSTGNTLRGRIHLQTAVVP
jgi:hypothetical protein